MRLAFGPLPQGVIHPRENECLDVVDVREPVAHEAGLVGGCGLHVAGEPM